MVGLLEVEAKDLLGKSSPIFGCDPRHGVVGPHRQHAYTRTDHAEEVRRGRRGCAGMDEPCVTASMLDGKSPVLVCWTNNLSLHLHQSVDAGLVSCNLLSPSNHFWSGASPSTGGEKEYSPQLWNDSLDDVNSILCVGS